MYDTSAMFNPQYDCLRQRLGREKLLFSYSFYSVTMNCKIDFIVRDRSNDTKQMKLKPFINIDYSLDNINQVLLIQCNNSIMQNMNTKPKVLTTP